MQQAEIPSTADKQVSRNLCFWPQGSQLSQHIPWVSCEKGCPAACSSCPTCQTSHSPEEGAQVYSLGKSTSRHQHDLLMRCFRKTETPHPARDEARVSMTLSVSPRRVTLPDTTRSGPSEPHASDEVVAAAAGPPLRRRHAGAWTSRAAAFLPRQLLFPRRARCAARWYRVRSLAVPAGGTHRK